MSPKQAKLVNQSGYQFFIAIAGGGQSFIGEFTKISGASQSLVGALVPYAQPVFDEFVGEHVQQYVSESAARKLAMASYRTCLGIGIGASRALGIGVSSSIAKDDERSGREHKMYLAVHGYAKTFAQTLILKQGRTRIEEENMFREMIECQLANMTNANLTPQNVCVPHGAIELRDSETRSSRVAKRPPLFALGFTTPDTLGPIAIYPGSWNPMHDAHKAIYQTAQEILGVVPTMELCLNNTDKPSIDYLEAQDRIATIGNHPYIITDTSTFQSKIRKLSELYPSNPLIFIVGADTWKRIWDPKYAGPLHLLEQEWNELGVKFLVFGRNGETIPQPFKWGETLRIKDARATDFTMSMSSTEIREQQ
jgi:nicotinic acid mononucleotide adenylyltransferase